MAKHVWSVLCYKGCLDQYTNQVSLLDVIEGIIIKPMEPVPEIPMGKEIHLPVQMSLVSLWIRSDMAVPEEPMTRVRTIVPGGASRSPQMIKIDLTKYPRTRNFLRFETLPFHGEGFFYFMIELHDAASGEWRTLAEIPLELKVEPYTALEGAATRSEQKPAQR